MIALLTIAVPNRRFGAAPISKCLLKEADGNESRIQTEAGG
jgi:hypothetical protein